MPRIRTVKPEFFKHETLADLSALHRLLFIGLWTQADREGRLEDRPRRLKVEILPYDECDLDGMLDELWRSGFIIRYCVAGKNYIAIPSFKEHQRITGKEVESALEIPAPTGDQLETHPGHARETPETHTGAQEGNGRERKKETLSSLDSTGVVLPLLAPPEKQPSPVEQVFAHWQKVMRKPRAVLDSKRERLIKARLDEGRTVEELCRAVSGYLKSPHHMGQNEQGRKYDDILLICRDAAHVEAFMPAAAVATGPPPTRRKSAEEIAAEVNQEFEAKHGGI